MINATNPDPSSATMTPREESGQAEVTKDQYSGGSSSSSHLHGRPKEDGEVLSEDRKLVAKEAEPQGGGGRGDEEEDEEWSKLRCGSQCTEELAKKEKQKQDRKNRQNRCADYPGFAFGSAMFGSDTTMKFNIIKNELHNIMRSQLKRVDGEVKALSSRIKEFDEKLEESERYIREATSVLAEAVALQIEDSKNRSEEDEKESNLSAFDQHVLFLEAQLREARIKASQSVQILEDCNVEQRNILKNTQPELPANPQVVELCISSPEVEELSMSQDMAPPMVSGPQPCQTSTRGEEGALRVDSENNRLPSEPLGSRNPIKDSSRLKSSCLAETNNNSTVDNNVNRTIEDNMNGNL